VQFIIAGAFGLAAARKNRCLVCCMLCTVYTSGHRHQSSELEGNCSLSIRIRTFVRRDSGINIFVHAGHRPIPLTYLSIYLSLFVCVNNQPLSLPSYRTITHRLLLQKAHQLFLTNSFLSCDIIHKSELKRLINTDNYGHSTHYTCLHRIRHMFLGHYMHVW